MDRTPHPSSVKTLVIVILLLVVGIQGYFLWRGHETQAPPAPVAQSPKAGLQDQEAPKQSPREAQAPAPEPAPAAPAAQPAKPAATPGTVEVATFHHDWKRRDQVIVSFSKPVGETESTGALASPPFEITPPVPGDWTWAGPYILRFRSADKNGFDPSVTYSFKAVPGNFLPAGESLAGRTEFAVSPEPLNVRKWTAELDPVPGKPGWYTVSGSVAFSKDIFPQQMAPALRMIDPRLGEKSPVPLEFATERDWPYDTLRFVSVPFEADAKKRMFTLVLDKDRAESKDGFRLARQEAYAFPVSHSGVLEARKPGDYDRDRKGWELGFSAKVDPAEVRAKLTLEPPVEGFSVGRDYGGGLVLSGNFKPGATYSVVLAKGLTALSGAVLPQDAKFSLAVPNLEPSVKFAHQGMFLPASGSGNLALASVNAKGASLRVERVYRNNIFFSLNYYADTAFGDAGYYGDEEGGYYGGSGGVLPYLGDAVAEFKAATASPRNQAVNTPVNIAREVRDFEPGLYRVALTREGADQPSDQKWMLITDLGIAAKRGHDDILVWVCSQKDLTPVAGARVKVVSTTNQVLFQGVTDARGLWRAQGLANLAEDKVPFMVTAEKDKDYSFLHFERFRTDMTGLDVSGVEVAQAGYQAFLWGERDIYRPGETVSGMVCVRDPQLGAPKPLPVKLRWTDPQGREVAVENVRTDAQGLAAFTRAIPAHFPTGPYVLEALAGDDAIGQYRFQVEDFKPDRIATAVTPGVERAAPGRELAFTVEGRYLFGAPGAGLASEAQVTLVPSAFTPKGFEDYAFGDPERAFEPQTILWKEAALDEEGRAAYSAPIPEKLSPPAALTAVVTARVSEAGGRGVAARAKVPVDAYLSYPGIKKIGQSGLKPGEQHEFEYVVVDGQGAKATAKSLVAELWEDRWQTVLRRGDEGGFRYETKRDSRLVERREIASPGSSGRVGFTPPKFGSYRLRVADPDSGAAAQMTFWAEGQGYNPWGVENPARLELVPAKPDWMPGETAKLQVRSPYPGKLLVTVESTGVRDVLVVDMPANTGEVSVPIKQGYGPNVYVTAVLARKGADVLPGQAGRAFGTVSLSVAREAGRQAVAILTPALIKPETELTVTAKADPGSIVTLAAVDEGILQLIAQKTPDPWASFYAKRALEVESFDTWALLLPEVKALAGKSPAGGDEDMGRYLRTESPQGEKSVAFWSGPLKADAQGRVQWTIPVPRFQGALRVMAVAVNGNRFGSAEAMTRVKSPLVLMPTFPRFAQLDESMRLPVTLRNDTGAPGRFRLALDASGPMRAEDPVQELAIEPGKDATAFFTVSTGAGEGVARLAVKAAGNGESAVSEAELLVRSPLPAVSRIAAGVNEGASVELALAGAEGLLPSTVRRDLRVGRYPLVRYSGKLEALLGYPYGCIEQTVSKAFPLLYFANLARELEPDALAKGSPEAMVQQGVSRVLSLQLPSGGFGMWPGADGEQAWASVYATHFLLEAGKAGHQVPRQALSRALGYLVDLVKQFHKGGAQKTQAYGLYVLALSGNPDKGTMDNLRDRQGAKLPADARALLAAAYAASGNAKGGEALLRNLPAPQAAPREDDIFDSPLRAAALTLAALIDVGPAGQEAAKAARELERLMEAAGTVSTQEAGMAFMALGKLFARQQAGPTCPVELTSGADRLAAFDTAKTAVFRNVQAKGPLALKLGGACGPGAVFYSLDVRGVPGKSAYKPFADGLELKREFLDRQGQPLDVAKLRQGAAVLVKTSVRSTSGALKNVVLTQLLPSGLEVENPRLATTDKLPWMEEPAKTDYADYRADRVNVFLDLPGGEWQHVFTLCRAVIPGSYSLPPVQAEAMYHPEIKAGTELGSLVVEGR